MTWFHLEDHESQPFHLQMETAVKEVLWLLHISDSRKFQLQELVAQLLVLNALSSVSDESQTLPIFQGLTMYVIPTQISFNSENNL